MKEDNGRNRKGGSVPPKKGILIRRRGYPNKRHRLAVFFWEQEKMVHLRL